MQCKNLSDKDMIFLNKQTKELHVKSQLVLEQIGNLFVPKQAEPVILLFQYKLSM